MSSSIADGKITKFSEIQNLEASTCIDGIVDVVSSTSSSSIACRVKYLVDTPEIIQGFLDKSLFLESAVRFMTANFVHSSLDKNYDFKNLREWNIVESFQVEISKRSREKLLLLDLSIDAYANALAAVMFIDRLPVLDLFLDSRMSCILQKRDACLLDNLSHVITVFCDIANMVQLTLAQWNTKSRFRDCVMAFLCTVIGLFDQKKRFLLEWFDNCGLRIFSDVNGTYLIHAFKNAQHISLAEKKIRATLLQDNQVLEGSLEWLNSVSVSKVISPWKTTSELVLGLGRHLDIWMEFFEYAFIGRMERIVKSKFDELRKSLNVNKWIDDIAEASVDETDYPGIEANRISTFVHTYFEDVLEDLLIFFESPNASLRRDDLAPCFQSHCFGIMYYILLGLEVEMEQLYEETMEITNNKGDFVMPRDVAVLRLLSIQRLLFAFQKRSEQITMILGSPKLWVTKAMAHLPTNSSIDSPKSGRTGHVGAPLKEQASLLDSAGDGDSLSSELELLNRITKDLFSEARDLWMSWEPEKLSANLFHNLLQDDNLLASAPPTVSTL
ncbi:hypothetical protein POM88_053533 [Heracleum sosnowskyi]|uniref:Conserved oligomeric Golgi complex subunit 1 n=1 Tax=Heracleum sosnowskyi TaxID=360622 RepID=A0AAD8GPT2_9APIA|nr:hypothetical protein POM88_053533 [Heracleum sosnowskyi]